MHTHPDASSGYEAIAGEFTRHRSASVIGRATVLAWSAQLPPGASILELGCGSGVPISTSLAQRGFTIAGIDASPTLLVEFQRQVPGATWACEAVEESSFFDRKFDAVLAVGLMFLLPAESQRRVLARVGHLLEEGGRFLFNAPSQACEWNDILTGRASRSLGYDEYEAAMRGAGLTLAGACNDEGGSHYFSAVRSARP